MWKYENPSVLFNEYGDISRLVANTRIGLSASPDSMQTLADLLNFGYDMTAYAVYLQTGIRDHCEKVAPPDIGHAENQIFDQETGPWDNGHWEWVLEVLQPLGLFAAKLCHQLTEFNEKYGTSLDTGLFAYTVVEPAGYALAGAMLNAGGTRFQAEEVQALGKQLLVTELLHELRKHPRTTLLQFQQHLQTTLGETGKLPPEPGSAQWIELHAGPTRPFKYDVGQKVYYCYTMGAVHGRTVLARIGGMAVLETKDGVQISPYNWYQLDEKGNWLPEHALHPDADAAQLAPASHNDFRGYNPSEEDVWQPSLLSPKGRQPVADPKDQ